MDLLEYAGISKNIKKTNIGISYLGSKRKISYDILNIIAKQAPQARHFFYNMPQDRFKEIWSKETYASFNVISKDCGAKIRPQRTERLFMVR